MGTKNTMTTYVYHAGSLESEIKFIANTTSVIARKNENETMVLVCGLETIKVNYFIQSREWDLNPRPADYESAALPLSYLGILRLFYSNKVRNIPIKYCLKKFLYCGNIFIELGLNPLEF